MKNIIIFLMSISFIFSLCTSNIFAKKAEKIIKVGAVDLKKVFENSQGKKIADEQLDKKRLSFEQDKKKKEDEIKELKSEYENKKYTMDDNEKEKKQLEIDKKVLELKEYIQKSNDQLIAEEDKLLVPIIDDIKNTIRAVSIKYGYDIILDKSTYILFIDKEFDITDDVIEELKVKYKQ